MPKGWGDEWREFDPTAPRGVAVAAKKPRRSKYGNVRTAVDADLMMWNAEGGSNAHGYVEFDSMREAKRYVALMLEQRAGTISGLELQPRYSLTAVNAVGVRQVVGAYRGDFRYIRNMQVIVEDSKGHQTELYKWKRKHLKAEHGIEIVET